MDDGAFKNDGFDASEGQSDSSEGGYQMMPWVEFMTELRAQVGRRPHHKLKLMSKIVNTAKNERYNTDRRPKNALVEHGFLPDEFQRFMSVVDNPQDRLAFLLIAVLGLRPNEAARLRGRDVQKYRVVVSSPNGDYMKTWAYKLLIPASKGGYEADLRLPGAILQLLPVCGPNKPLLGMTETLIAQRFRRYRKLAEMDEIYGHGKPGGYNGKQERSLYQFSLKSLRYTGAQLVQADTGNILLASRLLRHRKVETTVRYLRKFMKPQLEAALERSSEVLLERAIIIKEDYVRCV